MRDLRSKLFSVFEAEADRNAEFTADLRALVSLSDEQAEHCVDALVPLTQAKTDSEAEPILHRLEELGIRRATASAAIGVLEWFAIKGIDDDFRDDSVDAWVTDLETLEVVDAGSKLRHTLQRLEERLDQFERSRRTKTYERGALPTLRGVSTTVELRGVQRNAYSWGDSLDEYAPEFVGVVPVASVALRLDQPNESHTYLQLSHRDLKLLISRLRACELEMVALQRHLTSKSEP